MKLHEFAALHKVNMRDLAKELGISYQAVYLFNRKSQISVRTLVRLCDAFQKFGVQITPSELLKELTEEVI